MTTEIKRILFAGDSYTAGAELSNINYRYSKLVSKYFDIEEDNIARNGNSNYGILTDALDALSKNSYDGCVIQFSYFNRITLPIQDTLFPCNPTVGPEHKHEAHLLLKYVASTNKNINIYADYYISLIRMFNSVCIYEYNIKPLFVFLDNLHKQYLIKSIDINYAHNSIEDIIGTNKNKKCKFGPKWHPLEDGHKMLAETLFIPEIKKHYG